MASSKREYNFRPLGPHETFFHHLAHKYNSCLYIHVAVINSSHKLLPEDVKKAFLILAEHQEALRMRIVPDEDEHLSYRFMPMEDPTQLDMRITTLKRKNEWPTVVTEESKHYLDCYNGPLWRVVMANVEEIEAEEDVLPCESHQHIIFVVLHHSISDGTSGFDLVYRQFLPILSALVNKGHYDDDSLPYMQLTKPTEELCGLKSERNTSKTIIPWYKQLHLDVLRWKNRNIREKYVYMKKFCFPDEHERTISNILKEPLCKPVLFGREITSCIMEAAKLKRVSVHSIILGVSSVALCATSEEAGIILPKTIKHSWPVNLRRHLGLTSPQPMALHICLATTETERKVEHTHDEFWKMCTKIHTKVKQQMSKEYAISWLGNTQNLLNSTRNCRLHVALTESGATSLTGTSNLGICDSDPKPKLTDGEIKLEMIEHHFTVTGLRHLHEQPFFHSVSTFKSRLAWNITYDTRIISPRFLDSYLQKIQEACWKYCGEAATCNSQM